MNLLIKTLHQNTDDFLRICNKYKSLVTKNSFLTKPIMNYADDTVGDIVQIAKKSTQKRNAIGITKEILEEHLAQGKSTTEIAEMYGCKRVTISKYVRNLLGISTKKVVKVSDDVLRAQVAEGLSLPQLAEKNNCSITTIRNRLNEIGLRTLEAERATQISDETLKTLVISGWDCKSIAEKYGVSELQVGKILKRLGLETDVAKFEKMVTKQDILDLYKSGAKKEQLCEIFGVPDYVLERTLQRFGLSAYKTPVKQAIDKQVEITPSLLRKMTKAGKTKEQIAKELGVTSDTITSKLNEYDIAHEITPRVEEALSDIAALKQMIKNGKTVEDIAFSYDLDVNSVEKHLHSVGIFDYGTNASRLKKLQMLAGQGLPESQIAKILKISDDELKNMMHYYDIKVTIPKERFLAAYKESLYMRFSGKPDVLNLKTLFGLSDKKFNQITGQYRKELDIIFQEVSSQFKA